MIVSFADRAKTPSTVIKNALNGDFDVHDERGRASIHASISESLSFLLCFVRLQGCALT